MMVQKVEHKKTGVVGLMKVEANENGKFEIQAEGKVKETAESTVKRWWKKVGEPFNPESEVKSEKAEKAPEKKEPAKKPEPKKAEKAPKKPEPKKEGEGKKRGRKRDPLSIESLCLNLLKQGGTINEMAAQLEEDLKEHQMMCSDCKMRMRRAVYYAEKETGLTLKKDTSEGRGKTFYQLV